MDLGCRRAGDGEVGEATARYLVDQLSDLGITSEREEFELTPTRAVAINLLSKETGEESSLVLPGVYFSETASQSRVLRGLADSAGVSENVSGFSLSAGKTEPVRQIKVLATIRGTRFSERVLELCAHHDTVPATVGGDDNSTHVAVLLEVARLLQANPPACSVRLCFFAAEEIGLRGSAEHITRLRAADRLDEVFGLINLDSIGFLTDTGEFRSDRYHRPTDGLEGLHLENLQRVTAMVTAAALEAALQAAE